MDIHLVLDLDSTLIFSIFMKEQIQRINKENIANKLKNKIYPLTLIDGGDRTLKGSGILEKFILVLRPHLKEFIEYISSKIGHIHIWSAGQYRYVRAIDNIIFPNDLIDRILTSKACSYYEHGKIIKKLKEENFDLSKTIIIDDRDDTFEENIKNAIHIPRYEPDSTIEALEKDDDALLKIINWFKNSGVINCDDVRNIEKPNLF